MSNFDLARLGAGMIGAVLAFVSVINVWMTWMSKGDTTFHWTLTAIGLHWCCKQ